MSVEQDVIEDSGGGESDHGCRHQKVGNLLDLIVPEKPNIPVTKEKKMDNGCLVILNTPATYFDKRKG